MRNIEDNAGEVRELFGDEWNDLRFNERVAAKAYYKHGCKSKAKIKSWLNRCNWKLYDGGGESEEDLLFLIDTMRLLPRRYTESDVPQIIENWKRKQKNRFEYVEYWGDPDYSDDYTESFAGYVVWG